MGEATAVGAAADLLRQRSMTPPLLPRPPPVNIAASSPKPSSPLPAGPDSAISNPSSASEAVVLALLASGQVLGAARAARRLPGGTSAGMAHKILQAAAGQQDEAVFVSVYRCFRQQLMRWFPRIDVARSQLMPTVSS